jgi:hypothetical protein
LAGTADGVVIPLRAIFRSTIIAYKSAVPTCLRLETYCKVGGSEMLCDPTEGMVSEGRFSDYGLRFLATVSEKRNISLGAVVLGETRA